MRQEIIQFGDHRIKWFIQIGETIFNKEKKSRTIGLGIAFGTAVGAITGQVVFNNLALHEKESLSLPHGEF